MATEQSKLIRKWHLVVSGDQKQVEINFMTMDGVWHPLYFVTDKVAISTLTTGKKSGKQG